MRAALLIRTHQEEHTFRPEQTLPAAEARQWLDRAFVDMDCEPLRASGKVLTKDKVLAVAQAAGAKGFADPVWGGQFAAAALGALGLEALSIDLDSGQLG
jgi:hypothetical protein